jgi:hypothetical protein
VDVEYRQKGAVQGPAVIHASLHRAFRGISAAIALWTFASPLLETLHEADRVHVACPEDGELVDAPVAAAHQHARASRNGASLFAEHDSSGPVSSDRGHDHCAIASQAHLRGREESRKLSVPLLLQAAAVPAAAQEPARLSSLAIYRFAPKASPPLA